jgi:hypothetical protein
MPKGSGPSGRCCSISSTQKGCSPIERCVSPGWKDLLEEFRVVRESSEYLFDSLSDAQLRFVGTVWERPLNAFTIGFILPGHVAHHMQILEERYL